MIRFFTALLCLANAAAAENRLPNPSFEARAADGVEGWTSRAWSGGDEARREVASPGRSGGHCVSIGSAKGADVAWTTKVAVEAGKAYELSGWIKTEEVKGAVGALLNIQNMQSVKTPAVTGTSDWTRVSAVFQSGAQRELEINCLFGGWGNSTGQVWFDDVALTEISGGEYARRNEERGREVLRGLNGLVAAPAMGEVALPGHLMSVGVDDRGKVFVSGTVRQGAEEISLLQSSFLHEADMALTTVEEKEAWIRANYSARIAQAQGLQDQNGDGAVDVKDLTVRSEKIFTLRDADHDGLFDGATLFADGFNEITTGVAHSVAPIGDSVYSTIIPDLWKLRDADGDGRAEVKTRLVHGFANHIGYGNHDLHSVVQGYDGRLYWSMGDRGLNVLSKEGKRWAYPHTGAILRCNPDGSGFEVFASGLRNCQYFDFDDYGNLFAMDHDADFQGEMERLVYLPEGSDSGWRNYYQYRQINRVLGDKAKDLYNPWLAEVMWKPWHSGQPSHFLPPIENSWNAPASFSWQPGQALGGKYRGHFLLGGMGDIRAFKMVAEGASFRREGGDAVIGGLGAQVLSSMFAPDGGLYFVLWSPPQGRPPLWVLREDPKGKSGDVEALLAQGFGKRSGTELAVLLGHDDRRVRASAQSELAARAAVEVLKRVALDGKAPQLARIHGLWGLTQLKCWDAELVGSLATSSDDELQAQAARYVGDVGIHDRTGAASSKWAPMLLNHRSPRVKSLAAIACGKLRSRPATAGLLAMLQDAGNANPVLRETGVLGLMGAADPVELEGLSANQSEAVRIAAVVSLRRMGAARELMKFLDDPSPQVMSDAVRALYDAADAGTFEAAPEALAAVAGKLGPSSPGAVNVRALAANRRMGTREAMARILAFLTAPDHQRPMERLMATDILDSWSGAPALDPVDGRYFPVPAFSAGDLEAELSPHLWKLMSDRDPAIAVRFIELSARMKVSEDSLTRGAAQISDESLALTLRLAWFGWLQKQHPERAVAVALTALGSGTFEVRLAAATYLLDRQIKTSEVSDHVKQTLRSSKDVRELQGALGLLKKVPASGVALRDLVTDLRTGKIAAPIQFDVIEAARAAAPKDQELAALLAAYDEWAKQQKPPGEFAVALEGGDAARGESLFLGHTTAMCSKCHALKKTDQQVGPSLEGVATRLTRAELLESMLDPQARVAPGYGLQVLELNDGRSVTGTQMSDTKDAIVLKSPDGQLSTYGKALIKSATQPVGAMPPVKLLLTTRDLRDLVAFLSTLQQPE